MAKSTMAKEARPASTKQEREEKAAKQAASRRDPDGGFGLGRGPSEAGRSDRVTRSQNINLAQYNPPVIEESPKESRVKNAVPASKKREAGDQPGGSSSKSRARKGNKPQGISELIYTPLHNAAIGSQTDPSLLSQNTTAMSATVRLLYVGRSDGVEKLPGGIFNRPNQSTLKTSLIKKVTQEDKGTYVPITKDHENKEIREKYEAEMKKIGEVLAERLHITGRLDDYDHRVEYRLNALPENFVLYQHATESGQLELNYFGHPRGIKSKYRLASEITHHIYWLATDPAGDEKNCKCIKCSPQGTIPKEKDVVTNETPTDPGGQIGYPSSQERFAMTFPPGLVPNPGSAPATYFPPSQYYQHSQLDGIQLDPHSGTGSGAYPPLEALDDGPRQDSNLDVSLTDMAHSEIIPLRATQLQTLGDASRQESSTAGVFDPTKPSPISCLQQLFDTQMLFHHRPGELIWADRHLGENQYPKLELALVTGRYTTTYELSDNICRYEILFLEAEDPLNEVFFEDIMTDHEDGVLLPFLARPPDAIKDPKIVKGLASGELEDLRCAILSPESMPLLAAQRIDSSYLLDTKLNIDEQYPAATRIFDLYKSLWLGAERIWPGDAVRIRYPQNPDDTESTDVMIITHIKETWEDPLRDTFDTRAHRFAAPSTLSVVGDIFTAEWVPQHEKPLTGADVLPEPLRHEVNIMNKHHTYPERREGFRRLPHDRHVEISLTDILGRWYPFQTLFPTYHSAQIQGIFRNKNIDPPLAGDKLLHRGKLIVPGQEGPHGLGKRNDGVDLLASFRCAIPENASFVPYAGSRWDPDDSLLEKSSDTALGAQHPQPEYDYGINPLKYRGPDGTWRVD